MITCWFNWIGLIVYAVMLLFYLATRENITGKNISEKEIDAKYYLLGIAILFSVFQIVPLCFHISLRNDRFGGFFIGYVIVISVLGILCSLFCVLEKRNENTLFGKLAKVCFLLTVLCNALIYLNLLCYLFLFLYFWLALDAYVLRAAVPAATVGSGTVARASATPLQKTSEIYGEYTKTAKSLANLSSKSKKENYRKKYLKFLDKLFNLYPDTSFNGRNKNNYRDGNATDIHHIDPQSHNTSGVGDLDNLALLSRDEHNKIHNEHAEFKGETNQQMLRRVTLKNCLVTLAAAFIGMILHSFLFAFVLTIAEALVSCLFAKERPKPKTILTEAVFSALYSLIYAIPVGFFCIFATLSYREVHQTGEWQINGIQIAFSVVLVLMAVYQQCVAHAKDPIKNSRTGASLFLWLLAFDGIYFAGELMEARLSLPEVVETIISSLYMLAITIVIRIVSEWLSRRRTRTVPQFTENAVADDEKKEL